jgi:hypothetical protein
MLFDPKPAPEPHCTKGLSISDGLFGLVFAVIAMGISVWGFRTLGPALDSAASFNIWFQADTPRVISNLTDVASNHYRTSVHPASSIILTPIVLGIGELGFTSLVAAKFLIALAAALSGGLFFCALRSFGLPRVPTVVFAALYLLSAAFIDWYAVIELNSVAGVTIVLALLALASGRTISPLWWLLISAGTLSITVTNWSVGLAATLVRWPPKRFAEISAAALALIVLLSSAQYFLFSNASLFFLPRSVVDETQWTQIAQQRNGGDAWEPLESLRSLLITTVVAPTPYIEIQSGDKVVTNQQTPWSDNIWGGIAASLAWIALLCCGIWGAMATPKLKPISFGLGMMLLIQMALHSVYGTVTFLYAPHFLPILVAICSFSWFSPARRGALALAIFVLAVGGFNNVVQFRNGAHLANQILSYGGNKIDPSFPANDVIIAAPTKR